MDKATFEALFRTHYAPLTSFAMRYVSEVAAAEEIVQDVFFKFWKKSANIVIHASEKAYLFGAVRNTCLNYLKHQKTVQEHLTFAKENQAKTEISHPLEVEELENRIQAAVQKLPEKCREIFLMSRTDSKTYKEIAAHLSLSIKTVENQMGKALRIMREELKDYLPLLALFTAYQCILEMEIGVLLL